MTRSWADVWAQRRLDESRDTVLGRLLATDGFDTSFGAMPETAWSEFVVSTANHLHLTVGSSVFEVGCGTGAFLYDLARIGCTVSGIDNSAGLIDSARMALPQGQFAVSDAADLQPTPQVDAVVSFGVFLYFPSLSYAELVLQRMVAKARRVVAVFDLPDAATAEEALAWRQRAAGGAAAYQERYRGLDHLSYSRAWMVDALRRLGLQGVEAQDQCIRGYPNGRFRFNVWGYVPAVESDSASCGPPWETTAASPLQGGLDHATD